MPCSTDVVLISLTHGVWQDGINKCRPYLVCCLGELNDVELGTESVDASILHENPWLKVDLKFSPDEQEIMQHVEFHLSVAVAPLYISSLTAAGAPAKASLVAPLPNSFASLDRRPIPSAININRKQNILKPDSSPSSNDRNLPACGGQFKPAASLLTVTDLEVLAAFLLPVLQETIQGTLGGKKNHDTCPL